MIRRLPLLGGASGAPGGGGDAARGDATGATRVAPRPPGRGAVAVVTSVLLHASGVVAVGLGSGGAAAPDDRPPSLVEMSLVAPPAPRLSPEPPLEPPGAPAGPARVAPRRGTPDPAPDRDDPIPAPTATPAIATTAVAAPPPAPPVPAKDHAPVLDFTAAGDIAAGARGTQGGAAAPGSGGGGGPGGLAGGGDGRGADLGRPVQLPARNWRCPWPPQADALHIDEQTVVLRVDVDARGRVQDAALLRDPGSGFGTAALRCARDARFTPARDAEGRSIPARSPPIRVRFTR